MILEVGQTVVLNAVANLTGKIAKIEADGVTIVVPNWISEANVLKLSFERLDILASM